MTARAASWCGCTPRKGGLAVARKEIDMQLISHEEDEDGDTFTWVATVK